jgi:hypothetical protein
MPGFASCFKIREIGRRLDGGEVRAFVNRFMVFAYAETG